MITLQRVSKDYGVTRALREASFSIPDGAVTALVGPNGAGKTTALKVIAGVCRPSGGSVLVDGAPYRASDSPGRTLGAMLSAEWIPGHMTGRSYLRYVCELQGTPARRADEALAAAGLDAAATTRVRAYSLGMRQRLGVAAVLLGRPRNLLLDEPINGLDPDGILWLRETVRDAARRGGAVLLSSHLMSELSLVADDVVMIVAGQVVRQGPLASVVGQERVAVYIESSNLDHARRALAAAGLRIELQGRGLAVEDCTPEEVGRLVYEAGGHLSHLGAMTRSLEESYFDAVAESSSGGGGDR